MRIGSQVVILSCFILAGCTSGFELSTDGYESFGRAGGSMQTPDGALEVEIDAGSLVGELELSVGQLDDCFAGALVCYEVEPAGLTLRKPVTLTVDLVGVEESALLDAELLSIYLREGGSWREARSLSADAEPTSITLATLGPVAIAPSRQR